MMSWMAWLNSTRRVFMWLGLTMMFTSGITAQTTSCFQAFTLGNDQILCAPDSQTLVEVDCDWDVLQLDWQVSGVPVALDSSSWSVTTTGIETLIAHAVIQSPNLIVNGDFSAGNSGFTSSMLFNPFTLIIPGSYAIMNDPAAIHPDFKMCQDHTTGGGGMLACNGSLLPNRDIWCQNVAVEPGGTYDLSFWSSALTENESAELVIRLDGQNLTTPQLLGPTTCEWVQSNLSWTAGLQTSVQFCIRNLNGANSGNDFAIDDIVMQEICQISDTVQVRHVPRQVLYLDSLFCAGDTLWVGGLPITGTGQDTVVLSDQWGCDSTIYLDVTFWDASIQFEPLDTLTCLRDSVELIVSVPPGPGMTTFTWLDPGGGVITDANGPTYVATQPGFYGVLVEQSTDHGSCAVGTFREVVEDREQPGADAGPDGLLTCLEDVVSLVVGGTQDPQFTYQWKEVSGSGGGPWNGATVNIDEPGVYQLSVTNPGNGCVGMDTVGISDGRITPGGLVGEIYGPLCEEGSGGFVPVDVLTGTPPFTFQLEQVTGGPVLTPPFTNLSAGDFWLTVTDANGCWWDTLLRIPEADLASLSLPQQLSGVGGEYLAVKPIKDIPDSLISTYVWTAPDLILTCSDCPVVEVTGLDHGILQLCLLLVDGCEICAQTYIRFDQPWLSYIPTAFSPNEDGINDVFRPLINDQVVTAVNLMAIYDRWGSLVYRWVAGPGSPALPGWEGRNGQTLFPSGVYAYQVDVQLLNGQVRQLKGEIQLIR